jgi:phage N-6-adenine-methyltransferase
MAPAISRFTRGILGSLGHGNRRRYAGRDDWRTPRGLFLQLDREFGFTLDAAAAAHNTQCPTFFSRETDALEQQWTGTVWCNPPYTSDVIGKFVRKAHEAASGGATVVMLVPVRADVPWWHDHALQASEIRFIRGRVRFEGMTGTAPFASCVLVFRPRGDGATPGRGCVRA